MSRKSKIARAEEVIQTLGLSECADNLVGGELLKGISGGEKRRLSLAVEMISGESNVRLEPTMTPHNDSIQDPAILVVGKLHSISSTWALVDLCSSN